MSLFLREIKKISKKLQIDSQDDFRYNVKASV